MADIWKRKLKTVLKRFDFDGDALLKEWDFVGLAENIIKEGNIRDQRAEELRGSMVKVIPKGIL